MTDESNTPSPENIDTPTSEERENAPGPAPSDTEPSRAELRERLDELRAEVTRLRAQQVRSQSGTGNWFQRHPVLSVSLVAGLGVAAGYGVSRLRARPPRTLSERAKQRLEQFTEDASKIAKRLQSDWGDRAALSGKELRKRAADVGQQLAKGAKTASERARTSGENASASLQDATKNAAQRVRDASTSATSEAEAAVEEQVEALTEAAGAEPDDQDRSVAQMLLTVGGLAAGGYLATKLRQLL